MRLLAREVSHITLTTDASGSWGCGGFTTPEIAWFQRQWDHRIESAAISAKELFPIILAAAIYGNKWNGYNILCKCDNQAVVTVFKSRYASDKSLMHLLRILFVFEAHFVFHITAQHIAGVHNTHADNISRNKHAEFLKAHQGIMPPSPTPISTLLTDFLFLQKEWTSLN